MIFAQTRSLVRDSMGGAWRRNTAVRLCECTPPQWMPTSMGPRVRTQLRCPRLETFLSVLVLSHDNPESAGDAERSRITTVMAVKWGYRKVARRSPSASGWRRRTAHIHLLRDGRVFLF